MLSTGCWQVIELDLSLHSVYLIVKTIPAYHVLHGGYILLLVMSMSPHELWAQTLQEGPPVAPPPPIEEVETARTEYRTMLRRRFLGNVGKVLGGMVVASGIVKHGFDVLTEELWQPEDARIDPAVGAENFEPGGERWLVFGGFGQQHSHNAANELFNAMGKTQPVDSISYPSHDFDADTLSPVIRRYITAHKISKLNIVGVSMGLPIALMSLRSIEQQKVRAAKSERSIAGLLLPDIGYMAGYSSPADMTDAFAAQGELTNLVETFAKKINYEPGACGKFIYSLVDGPGDTEKLEDISNIPQWERHLYDSFNETTNGCPPAMAWAQLVNFLQPFNFESQSSDYQTILGPNLQFIYVSPTNSDNIVDDSNAIQRYKGGLKTLGINRVHQLSSGDVGHANTIASAIAMGKYLLATSFGLDPNIIHQLNNDQEDTNA